jgi:hypothetical protein
LQSGKTEKLEKLMIRIGVFSLLYTFPAFSVLLGQLYENYAMGAWLGGFCGGECGGNINQPKPLYSVIMIK